MGETDAKNLYYKGVVGATFYVKIFEKVALTNPLVAKNSYQNRFFIDKKAFNLPILLFEPIFLFLVIGLFLGTVLFIGRTVKPVFLFWTPFAALSQIIWKAFSASSPSAKLIPILNICLVTQIISKTLKLISQPFFILKFSD